MSEVSLRKSHRCYVATTSRKVSNHWMFDLFASHGHRTNPYFAVKSSCTCQLFSVKCVRFLVSTEPEFRKIYRGLPKIAEVFEKIPKISCGLPKITEGVERFLTTSKQGQQFPILNIIWEFRRCSDDFLNTLKQLHTLVSVRHEKLVWMRHNFRAVGVRLAYNAWVLAGIPFPP